MNRSNKRHNTNIISAVITICTLLIATTVIADNTSNSTEKPGQLDSVLEGFDDSSTITNTLDETDQILDSFDDQIAPESPEKKTEPQIASPGQSDDNSETTNSNVESKTLLRLSSVYNHAHKKPTSTTNDYRGFSRLRIKVQPEFRVGMSVNWTAVLSFFAAYDAIYEIKGRDEYPDELLDAQEFEAELTDTYLQGSLATNFDLKFGRQIVPWGNSENLRVTDVLNPLDLREIGMTNISDLRLPVGSLKLDYYHHHHGDWNLSLIAIPEIRFNKLPPFGSDFYGSPSPPVPEQEISNGGSNTEYASALKGIFKGWDVSFHWANYYDDESHLETENNEIIRAHSRLNLIGITTNSIVGNWLFKSEFARISGLKFFGTPGLKFSRLDLLLGFEYSGIDNSALTLESVIRHIEDYNPLLSAGADNTDEDTFQTVVRYTGDFLREKLTINIIGSFHGKQAREGRFYRVAADYELIQSLIVTLGVTTYHSGDDPYFQLIQDNDRVYLNISYYF